MPIETLPNVVEEERLKFVRLEPTGDRVAVVWLARPKVNAVNMEMYREIRAVFTAFRTESEVGAVILAADGSHFCAGNDLDDFMTMTPENAAERMKVVREAFWAIHDTPVPVIAAVQGAALGTGLAIAASCDVIVAAEDARFGTPEVGVGVMGGAKHLSRLVPNGVLREMYYSAEPRPAADFVRFGTVSRVVARDQLLAAAHEIASSFTRHSSVALRFAKRALNEIETLDLKPGYEFEQGLTGELCGTFDGREALRALVEHRAPSYRHRL